jgi:hypothetical protein
MSSARAAADKEPSSAVTKKARARFQSNFIEFQSIQICILKIEFSVISILYCSG